MRFAAAQIPPEERRALVLSCLCNFVLLASYYILRPVRDTMATVIGAGRLQELVTATFAGTLLAAPIYAALAAHIKLRHLLPGVFWFWLLNVLLFAALFARMPDNRWLAASFLCVVQRRQSVHDQRVLESHGRRVLIRAGGAAVCR